MLSPRLNTRVLLKSPHLRVEVDYTHRIVVLTRTALAFEHAAALDTAISSLAQTVPDSLRTGYAVLIDMREAPTSVHPSLEPGFARYRKETERGFARGVVVVKTTLGKIRSGRLGVSCSIPVSTVDNYEDALTLLQKR